MSVKSGILRPQPNRSARIGVNLFPDYAHSSSGSPLVVKNAPLGHDETAEAAGKRYRTPDWTPILRGKAAVFPNMSFVRNQDLFHCWALGYQCWGFLVLGTVRWARGRADDPQHDGSGARRQERGATITLSGCCYTVPTARLPRYNRLRRKILYSVHREAVLSR